MIFKGKLTYAGEVKQGETKNGKNYATREFVLEELNPENPQYPMSGVFKIFKMDDYIKSVVDYFPKVGEVVEVDYSVSAKEYNGRWYGSNDVFKITKEDKAAPSSSKPAAQQAPAQPNFMEDDDDSLPF